jgi:hypothetical protein
VVKVKVDVSAPDVVDGIWSIGKSQEGNQIILSSAITDHITCISQPLMSVYRHQEQSPGIARPQKDWTADREKTQTYVPDSQRFVE